MIVAFIVWVFTGSKSTEKPIVNENDSGGDSNTAVIGVMVGVTVLVIVVFCVVVLVLFMLYWNNRRTQGQQQWPKDPEFQVDTIYKIHIIMLYTHIINFISHSCH